MSKLICYRINPDAPRIVPAGSERVWMDETVQRFAYRCLPLTIANSMGWEMLCPVAFEAEWSGEPGLGEIKVTSEDASVERYVASHFGHGVLTMLTHYLFRTDSGVGLWVRGSPNLPKDGIVALDGIVETDWLDFPFTMNWIFTRPGRVRFEKDEPFCFLTPFAYRGLDDVRPQIVPLEANAELDAAYSEYDHQRRDFNAKLAALDPEAAKQKWQKWYFQGRHPNGEPGNPLHLSKLRVAEPTREPPGRSNPDDEG